MSVSRRPATAPSSRGGLPWLTLGLILACLGFAVVLLFDPALTFFAGFNAARPSFGSALASLFLHQNVVHLMGNLVFLASVGPLLEYSTGRWRVALVFLAAGLAGTAGFWLMARGQEAALIGASGSVAGMIGYASVRHITMRVPILPGVGAPAWTIAALWVGLQLLGGVWSLGGQAGGVSYWSHAAGFLAGLVLAGVLGAGSQAELELGHAVLDQMNERGPAAALHAAEKHIARHPLDTKAWRQKAEAHAKLNEPRLQLEALRKLFEISPEDDHPVVLREILALRGLEEIPAIRRAQLADRWKEEDPILSGLILETLIGPGSDESQKPDAMLKLAELLKDREPGRSFVLLQELETQHPGHGATALARAKGMIGDGRS